MNYSNTACLYFQTASDWCTEIGTSIMFCLADLDLENTSKQADEDAVMSKCVSATVKESKDDS